MKQIIYFLIFLFVIPIIGYSQIRYKNIEGGSISEYGYKLIASKKDSSCYAETVVEITNISDSILIIRENGFISPQHGYTVLKPFHSFLYRLIRYEEYQYDISYTSKQERRFKIYKIDTNTYNSYINKKITLERDSFKIEKIYYDIINYKNLIRSVNTVDTSILKYKCENLYNEFLKKHASHTPDKKKIIIEAATKFGFIIESSPLLSPSTPKVNGILYNDSTYICHLTSLFKIKNTSSDTVYVDKVIFKAPKVQFYNIINNHKNGKPIKKKSSLKSTSTAYFLPGGINMNNYFIPPGCSAAYNYMYTTYLKSDDNPTLEHFLSKYNKLSGYICFNNGIKMPFTLNFDSQDLIQYPKQIIWE